MSAVNEYSSVSTQAKKTNNQLEHWLQKKSTALRCKKAKKVPAATVTAEVEDVGLESKCGDHAVRLSEVITRIGQDLVESEI